MAKVRRSGRWRTLLPLFVAICGCKSTDSTNVKTSGIWVFYTAEQTADGQVTVEGSFWVDGPFGTSVRLADGEHIEVNGVRSSSSTKVIVDPSPDGIYTVVLVRTDERIASTIQMPETPTILKLDPPDGVVTSGQDLTITWDASAPVEGPNLEVRVEGSCFTTQQVLAQDTGELTTRRLNASAQSDGCAIDITLIRKEGRGVNKQFDGGKADGYRYVHAKGQLVTPWS